VTPTQPPPNATVLLSHLGEVPKAEGVDFAIELEIGESNHACQKNHLRAAQAETGKELSALMPSILERAYKGEL